MVSIQGLKKYFLFFVYIKICQMSKEAYEKREIEIVDDGESFRINRRDL